MKNIARLFALLSLLTAACTGQTSDWPGETVLAHPRVHMIFLGSWDVNGETRIWTNLLNDPAFLGRLAEYGNTGAQMGDVVAMAPPPGYQVDSNIPAMINSLIDAGTLEPPIGEDVYMVWLPPGTVTLGMSGWQDNGYHAANVHGAYWYTWTAITDHLEDADSVASHELYESITDPYGDGVHVAGRGLTFPNDEVGDACEGSADDLEPLDGALVQRVWSVRAGACL